MQKSILVLEDDAVLNKLLVKQIREFGHEVNGCRSWNETQGKLNELHPDLIILDGQLPDANGYELIAHLANEYPTVMLTAYGSVKQAVQAMRDGAADYLMKPVSAEELSIIIDRVLNTVSLRRQVGYCKGQLNKQHSQLLVGNSQTLQQTVELIDAVAPTNMTVLIHGESGVGKELVARELHLRSERAEKNFIALDCCTLQETLFETELFGHEKGAFTGADRRKEGLIDVAEGGTLFLDEIGEIGPSIQAKLLRLLETGQYRRVGSAKDRVANVRIVAATNRNLDDMVAQGSFRHDLLYRLNAFTITVPALRERREDIPLLAEHFIANHNFSRRISKTISPAARRQMVAYNWPGNVRELRNVIERAIILSRERREIRPGDLAFCSSDNDLRQCETELRFDNDPSLAQIEQTYLKLLLEKYSGNRAKIARAMGVSERSIYRMIQKYGMN